MQVPASGVCAKHLRQTYAVTSSTRGWKSTPMGQAAEPRNESILQSFNLTMIGTVYRNYHHSALIVIFIFPGLPPEDPATLKSGVCMSYMDLCMPSQA